MEARVAFALSMILFGLSAKAVVHGIPASCNPANSSQCDAAMVSAAKASVGLPSCSGVVVAPNLILTAGHCIAYVGSTVPVSFSSRSDTREYAVKFARTYPQFNSSNIHGDFGLIMLSESITNADVLAHLPKVALGLGQSDTLFASGMGQTREQGLTPIDDLIATKNSLWLNATGQDHDIIVLKYIVSGSGLCGGDSGSPLFIKRGGQTLLFSTIVGIDGYCGKPGGSGYATLTSNYLTWIYQMTGIHLPTVSL